MSEAGAQASEAIAATPGAALARAREARGLSVSDVAMHLKFAPRQIDALEADDYGALPGGTFVRGMVRTYARFLGLDAEALAREVAARMGDAPKHLAGIADLKVPFQPGPKRSSRLYLLLSVAVLAAAALVAGDWVLRMREAAREAAAVPATPESATPAPAPSGPAPAGDAQQVVPAPAPTEPAKAEDAQAKAPAEPASPPLVAATKRLRLEFERESWVEIKDADGNTLLSRVNPAGSRQVVEGVAPLQIVIGNASAVRMTVNDEAFDLKPFTRVDIARITLD
ncbi:MAG: helix-turn-helix domain-containing protein [Burkholderiales bacterium]|jgi:cytoskeleton protein RodZ|nr:helix-turn-helix domain-containing protein [Burkholderiales bacterium]